MRTTLLSVAAAAIGVIWLGVSPSAAAESPWCMRFVAEGYSVDLCEYRTFEACNQQRLSEGNMSSCLPNPAFTFSRPGDSRQSKPKRSPQ